MSTYYITTNCPPPRAWYKDESLYEFISTDLFWLLAIAIIVNCWWVDKQCESFVDLARDKKPEKIEKEFDKVLNEPNSTKSPKSPTSQHNGLWLKSRITSEPRRCLAITICALVIPVQLLHGSWVVRTLWRFTTTFLKGTYPSLKPRILGFILYSPFTILIGVLWVAFLGIGVFLVAGQFLCVADLAQMKLSVEEKASKNVTQRLDDEEWDEVEKNSEQGEAEADREKNKARLAH
ncbi:hypothetical protein N0V84_000855 [Fusarium piperis]|uniref:Uncharacterized protein n=1 Tax=Fusarium piperis TaxID=1435070 RepID=A0A9W8WM16_9HYPO|nr:hypothetical protein N0V84_000855 [Fusarium piperis]